MDGEPTEQGDIIDHAIVKRSLRVFLVFKKMVLENFRKTPKSPDALI